MVHVGGVHSLSVVHAALPCDVHLAYEGKLIMLLRGGHGLWSRLLGVGVGGVIPPRVLMLVGYRDLPTAVCLACAFVYALCFKHYLPFGCGVDCCHPV